MQSIANLKVRTKPALNFVVHAAALLLAGMTQEYVSMVISVVADGMRKVAERTALTKKEIAAAIKNVQEEAAETAASKKRGNSELSGATKLADRAGDLFKNMTGNIHQIVDLIMLVAATSKKQWAMTGQISEDVEVISGVSAELADGILHSAQPACNVNELAEQHMENNGITGPEKPITAINDAGHEIMFWQGTADGEIVQQHTKYLRGNGP